jgi:hypothetical protein
LPKKAELHDEHLPKNWLAGVIIVALWIRTALLLLNYFWRILF